MNGRDDAYADCVFDLADLFEDEGRWSHTIPVLSVCSN